jgi:hypothetical protein
VNATWRKETHWGDTSTFASLWMRELRVQIGHRAHVDSILPAKERSGFRSAAEAARIHARVRGRIASARAELGVSAHGLRSVQLSLPSALDEPSPSAIASEVVRTTLVPAPVNGTMGQLARTRPRFSVRRARYAVAAAAALGYRPPGTRHGRVTCHARPTPSSGALKALRSFSSLTAQDQAN